MILAILSCTQNIRVYLIKDDEIDSVRYTHGEKINTYGIPVGKPKERDHLEGLVLESRIILKRDIKEIGREDVDWITLTIEAIAGCCE
jgi:hypothetical protein